MSVNYYALGKNTWQAIRLEDFRGARGERLDSLRQIGPVYLQTDDTYARVSCEIFNGEYRFVYWPEELLELFMKRFGVENPAGVEYWASDCISVYDEPKEGSFGWINGNHGNQIEYMYFQNMWEIADKYVPELRDPENMKLIFGEAYEPYVRALEEDRLKTEKDKKEAEDKEEELARQKEKTVLGLLKRFLKGRM